MSKYMRATVYALCLLSFSVVVIYNFSQVDSVNTKRKAYEYLGNGDCNWTDALAFGPDSDPYGTLLAGYPASGHRVAWQQTEGITGNAVLDDFFRLDLPKIGLVKTQFPHYEGIWSYGDHLSQTILLIRNPRWAMPSYHTLLSEIGYAHTWELAYDELPNVFSMRPPVEDWVKWRDYRFDDEILLWGYHIDFYMSRGEKYWLTYDFERNGQWPFRLLNETDRPWNRDNNCIHNLDCYPKDVISYERLTDTVDGPNELSKIATVLRGAEGVSVIPEDAIDCIWHETWINTPAPNNDDRDGPAREEYTFTVPQLERMKSRLEEMKEKYSTGSWVGVSNAIALVENFENYLVEVTAELDGLYANPPPTPAPDAGYKLEIQQWYNSKGKGNRYDKAKLQSWGVWDLISGFFDEEE